MASVASVIYFMLRERQGLDTEKERSIVARRRFPFVRHMPILEGQQKRAEWWKMIAAEKNGRRGREGTQKVWVKLRRKCYWFDTGGITPQLSSFSFICPCNGGVNTAGEGRGRGWDWGCDLAGWEHFIRIQSLLSFTSDHLSVLDEDMHVCSGAHVHTHCCPWTWMVVGVLITCWSCMDSNVQDML